jgi:hypothetical protein
VDRWVDNGLENDGCDRGCGRSFVMLNARSTAKLMGKGLLMRKAMRIPNRAARNRSASLVFGDLIRRYQHTNSENHNLRDLQIYLYSSRVDLGEAFESGITVILSQRGKTPRGLVNKHTMFCLANWTISRFGNHEAERIDSRTI